jgi:hypothetical protein
MIYRILSPSETYELIAKIWQAALSPPHEEGVVKMTRQHLKRNIRH